MAIPLTAAQLGVIFPAADADYLQQVAGELNNNLAAYGLDSTTRQAHFFAQVRQESGPAMEAEVESLAYSPQALVSLFGYYKQHPDEATADGYAKDPLTLKVTRPAAQETIANKIYASRLGNGDAASGDGWRFRGRGLVQVTGRDNYTRIAQQCAALYPDAGADFVANPDLMAGFPGAVRSAVGFWVLHGLPALADMGTGDADIDRITAIINLHTDSYADRRSNFATALNALA